MPLDEATSRLAFLLQRDLRRLLDRESGRRQRGEDVRYDEGSRIATWESRRGEVIGRWYGEPIATYQVHDRILRWSWAGGLPTSSASHAETVFKEGQARSVPQFTMSVVGDLDEVEATTLARLGAVVARAEGFHVVHGPETIEFLGLFDAARPRMATTRTSDTARTPEATRAPAMSRTPSTKPSPSRYSVPPPASAQRSPTPPPAAPYRSLPPIREVYEPRRVTHRDHGDPTSSPPPPVTSPPVVLREPSRDIFLPVANRVLAELAKAQPGYKQGLFVVTVDNASEKRRLVVVLVALDANGTMRALDPSQELVDVSARMVDGDRRDGNGPWRKLTARVVPKVDGGATLHVDVV